MVTQLQELLARSAHTTPNATALIYQDQSLTYAQLQQQVCGLAEQLKTQFELKKGERVAIYLEKRFETVISFFAALEAGAVFVPVNPLLKAAQVAHLLQDSGATLLITSAARALSLQSVLNENNSLKGVLLVDCQTDATGTATATATAQNNLNIQAWSTAQYSDGKHPPTSVSPSGSGDDLAAILYTSGSTGSPKGVVLSHRNMLVGAESVSSYLKNSADDRLLAVLPFSFDYGLSQLTTAFRVGASVVLLNHLFPGDVIRALEKYQITGLAAVPPLWIQLAPLNWPDKVVDSLRYITNSGGAMPTALLAKLRSVLPKTSIFLMYGLTEAFRSTYLDPAWLERKPNSIGKAIPSAEILILNEQNQICAPYEKGELVHCGVLVAQGYWQDEARTRERFRPLPSHLCSSPREIAVWSGDTVYQDEDGFYYFVGRNDEMIKCSGYRVSPGEIEALMEASGLVVESVVFGAPDTQLGQKIVLVCKVTDIEVTQVTILNYCRRELPAFMLPAVIDIVAEIPRTPNGKLDRSEVRQNWFRANEEKRGEV